MAVLLDYIWQSTFCLLFFFGIYFLFLRNEKAFSLTRVYILLTPVLALSFPLISIPVGFDKPDISLEQTQLFRAFSAQETPEKIAATFGLPEVTIESTKLPFLWEIKDYLFLIYLIIVLLLFFRLFWNFIQLRMVREKGWYQTRYNLQHKYYLIPTFGLTPIFSFFDKLFWDETQELKTEEKEQIIKHEIEHIKQGHSYDVLYYQVLTILFWFNPAIHLMRAALVDIHEYLADENVIKNSANKDGYAKLIVKIAFKGMDLPIGNYFIRSTTLKRLLMLKNPKKINWVKLFMVIPMTLILMGLISMKAETGQNLLQQNFNIEEIKRKLIASQDSLEIGIKVKKINTPIHYEHIGTLEDEKLKAQIGQLEYVFSNIKSDEDYIKVRGLIESLRNSSVFSKDYGDLKRSSDDLDESAKPEIGMESWFRKIREQVKLPENEDNLGLLGGNLVLEFVVNTEGQIENPMISRSLGGGIDQQVLDLLKDSELGKWIPATKNAEKVAMVQTVFIQFSEQRQKSDAHKFFKDTTPLLENEEPKVKSEQVIFDVVENAPEFKGGIQGWQNYVSQNLQFPEAALANNIEGVVYVAFVVSKDGKVVNPEILRGIGHGADEEALRLISDSPKWTPGMQRGQAVNVRMRLPIRFKLDEKQLNQKLLNSNTAEKIRLSDPVPSEKFNLHLKKNLKYPSEVMEASISGTVVTILKLGKDGSVKNFEVVESPSEELKNEVIRVLETNKHTWSVDPGKDEYLVTLPITFIIAKEEPSSNRYEGMKNEVVVTGYRASKPKQPQLNLTPIDKKAEPIFILNGKVISSKENISDLVSPDQIESLEIFKDKKAQKMTSEFDMLKNNAVIVIETKK
ncbi:MAG: TonB family protein [Mongoliibacter sp.]|uniref:M56 family metallopeptidase n=1 Tax=Mongoliibacter sp. TaxID=2022438 RepID=UPI0012EFB599|nr:M56 family metallopeptidase [Mongoliibacter sp.]TVP49443.1 MAG: TonB family protein [Mongoliibacter sp.]